MSSNLPPKRNSDCTPLGDTLCHQGCGSEVQTSIFENKNLESMETEREFYFHWSGPRLLHWLNDEASKRRITKEGPWFIVGSYLSVHILESNFVPKESQIEPIAIWLRLPQLPTKFYDGQILEKLGKKIGRLLKMDACTFSTLMGRYARICVQVPLNTPLKASITIGNHHQPIIYKGEGFLCKSYRRLGNTTSWPFTKTLGIKEVGKTPISDHIKQVEEWKTMAFSRRRKQTKAQLMVKKV